MDHGSWNNPAFQISREVKGCVPASHLPQSKSPSHGARFAYAIIIKLENATALGEQTRVLHRQFYITGVLYLVFNSLSIGS